MLQLPEDERLMVASRLLQSLPDQIATADLNEDEFMVELERRSDDWRDAVTSTKLKESMKIGK